MSKRKKVNHTAFLILIFPVLSFATDLKSVLRFEAVNQKTSAVQTPFLHLIPKDTRFNTNTTFDPRKQIKPWTPKIAPTPNSTSIGTESGGGGTTVEFQNRRVLLDLLLIPHFSTTQHNSNFNFYSLEEKLTSVSQSIVSSNIRFETDPVFHLAEKILEKWQDSLIPMFPIPLSATKQLINWQLTNKSLNGTPATYKSAKRPILAAYYNRHFNYTKKHERHHNVSIDIKEWNKLGVLSQAGLIIHETLRHQQFLNLNENTVAVLYQDEQLQKATAIILLCRPRPTLKHYLSNLLIGLENELNKESNFGPFDQVISQYCQSSFSENDFYNVQLDWSLP